MFDASRFAVTQHFATSKDGTKVHLLYTCIYIYLYAYIVICVQYMYIHKAQGATAYVRRGTLCGDGLTRLQKTAPRCVFCFRLYIFTCNICVYVCVCVCVCVFVAIRGRAALCDFRGRHQGILIY